MKTTMHIDDAVLAEVMSLTGATTKTQAVEMALKQLARRHKLKRLLRQGLGVSGPELAAMFVEHPGYPEKEEKPGWSPKTPRRMGRPLLVDSSFYIRTSCEGRDPLLLLAELPEEWEVATCGVVWAEVLRGTVQPMVRERFDTAFSEMEYLESSRSMWPRVARLAWSLDREGATVTLPDLTIAACALEADASVLTFDSDFSRIPGLDVRGSLASLASIT